MSSYTWKAQFTLNLPQIDDTHREFVQLIGALMQARDEAFPRLFHELVAHTEAHFEQENRWMEETAFAPITVHQGEHARVLEITHQIAEAVDNGDLQAGRTFVSQLPAWFEQHNATMDWALATHIVRNRQFARLA